MADLKVRTTFSKFVTLPHLYVRVCHEAAVPRARALLGHLFIGGRKQVVVHRDHHRNEHDGVVEHVQLYARHPVLNETRWNRTTEKIVPGDRLRLQQRMFDMVKELDPERDRPPAPIELASKTGPKEPETDEHDQRIPVMQSLRRDQPWVELAEQAPRFGYGPSERVDLERLQQMFGPMRKHHDRK